MLGLYYIWLSLSRNNLLDNEKPLCCLSIPALLLPKILSDFSIS